MSEISEDEMIVFRVLADRALITEPGYVIPKLADAVHKLLAEVEQLKYERRLLGACRRHLDEIADPEGRYTVDAVKTAGDLAQRIVDEIGHSVTDEPALGPEFRERIAELERELEWAVAERDQALKQIMKPDYEKLVDAYLSGAKPVAEQLYRLRGQIVTLMGIVRGMERFDGYDPATASVTVHAIKEIFEPASRPPVAPDVDHV